MFAYSKSVPRESNARLDGAGFAITGRGKGFYIRFENGWTVSVQFGGGNYSENYNWEIGGEARRQLPPSSTAEIAAWDEFGNWHKFSVRDDGDAYKDTAAGWKTPAEVLAFFNMIAALPPGTPKSAKEPDTPHDFTEKR